MCLHASFPHVSSPPPLHGASTGVPSWWTGPRLTAPLVHRWILPDQKIIMKGVSLALHASVSTPAFLAGHLHTVDIRCESVGGAAARHPLTQLSGGNFMRTVHLEVLDCCQPPESQVKKSRVQ